MSAPTLHRPVRPLLPADDLPRPAAGTRSAPDSTAWGATHGSRRRAFPVGRKLGCLAGVGALTSLLISGLSISGLGTLARLDAQMQDLQAAQSALLQLDTRSSELKVDGYKAAVRPDPAEQVAELREDVATGTDLLATLQALALPDALAERVDVVDSAYATYSAGIARYVDSAIEDQRASRRAFQDIQTANDAMDDVLSSTIEQALAAEAASQDELAATISRTKWTIGLAAVLGLAGARS